MLGGQTALITGAGSGIGRALALEGAQRGVTLFLVGRRPEKLRETRRLMSRHAIARPIVADISKPDGRLLIRDTILRHTGLLHLLVNNAGQFARRALADMRDAEVGNMVDVNLVAPMLLIRDLLPLLERSAPSRIVNIGSMYGDIAYPEISVYSATKFGLRGLSDALRRELAARKIAVTYVAPRATRTDAMKPFANTFEKEGVKIDGPDFVANWIWNAVEKRQRTAYSPTFERVFVALQRVAPSLIDRSLGSRPANKPKRRRRWRRIQATAEWRAARSAYDENKPNAEALFHSLVEKYPDEPDPHGFLGNIYYHSGHFSEAARHYHAAAVQLLKQGNREHAASIISLISRIDPALADTLRS